MECLGFSSIRSQIAFCVTKLTYFASLLHHVWPFNIYFHHSIKLFFGIYRVLLLAETSLTFPAVENYGMIVL